MISSARIKELRDLHGRTTQGPWSHSGTRIDTGACFADVCDSEDATFIASAHASLPELLRTIEELRAQLLDACEVAEQLRAFALDGLNDMTRLIAEHRIHYIEDLRKKAEGTP